MSETNNIDSNTSHRALSAFKSGHLNSAMAILKEEFPDISDIDNKHTLASLLYTDENSTLDNKEQAVEVWHECARAGNDISQALLGYLYEVGEHVEKNPEVAIAWLTKAADQDYAPALGNLSRIFQTGLPSIEKNWGMAMQYLDRAADLGDPEAMLTLAHFFSEGIGVDKSCEKSNALNFKALELGSSKAAYNLGVAFEFGKGVEADHQKAAKFYEVAAKAGIPLAMHNLAALHFNKSITPNNIQIAKFLYMSAASLGSSMSSYNLGLMYRSGEGVEKNIQAALGWFLLADKQGYDIPKDLLNDLASELNSEEIQKSQDFVWAFPGSFQHQMAES